MDPPDAAQTETDRDRDHRVAAWILVGQRRSLIPIEPLPEPLRPRTVAEGYALQRAVSARLTAAGLGDVVGHKIGCTTGVMQRFLEIGHPCAGTIHAGAVRHRAARLPRRRFVKLGIECEIAVLIGRDLGRQTRRSIPRQRGHCRRRRCMPASRSSTTAIAISAGRRPYLDRRRLLPERLRARRAGQDWRQLDLAALTGTIVVDGRRAGSGTGPRSWSTR